jgi:hemerythrin-like domain-containing protein
VLGALRTWPRAYGRGAALPADRDAFVNFLTTYAGHFHHQREEEVLFPVA